MKGMINMATREEKRQAVLCVTHKLDKKYGRYHWAFNDNVDKEPEVIKMRQMFKETEDKQELRDASNLKKSAKEKFVIEAYKDGRSVAEIMRALGMKGNASIYRILDYKGIPRHKEYHARDITKDEVKKAMACCWGRADTVNELQKKYPDILPTDLDYLIKKYNLFDEREELIRRWRCRYLAINGKIIRFDSMKDVADYLGISQSWLSHSIKGDNPKYKVYTWKEHVRGDDKQ